MGIALYTPIAPPEVERRFLELRQALHFPKTLLSIYRIAREDFSPAVLDDHLFSFWGFHHLPADLRHRARPWRKVQLRAIEPADVTGLGVWEMAFMVNMAMEDEEPIPEYSHQSGEGFRFLLPKLARFMGKNEEEARFAAQHGLEWCEGAWCAEERRHSNTLARIIERLMKRPPRRDNPNRPMVVTSSEEDALQHLISRQTTEWNASSSYIVMAAHATGHLHDLLRNLERDEVKHLAIISAASAYLLGPRPWRRFLDLVRKGLENFTSQKKSRSSGDVFGANPITAIEGIVAHLLTEFFLRRWLKILPLHTLALVFETPSSLPDYGVFTPSPERQAEIHEAMLSGRRKRQSLQRWPEPQRRDALAQRHFDDAHEVEIRLCINTALDGFQGAGVAGSPGNRELRRAIRRMTPRAAARLRTALLNRLRSFEVLQRHLPLAQSGQHADKASV